MPTVVAEVLILVRVECRCRERDVVAGEAEIRDVAEVLAHPNRRARCDDVVEAGAQAALPGVHVVLIDEDLVGAAEVDVVEEAALAVVQLHQGAELECVGVLLVLARGEEVRVVRVL